MAAYRPIVDEPVMRLALGVLDKLSAGDGSGAVEDYARLCSMPCGRRGAGAWGVAGRSAPGSGIPPMPLWWSRAGEDPALEAAARRDIETFTLLAELDWDQVLAEVGGKRRGSMGRCWPTCPGGGGAARFLLRS